MNDWVIIPDPESRGDRDLPSRRRRGPAFAAGVAVLVVAVGLGGYILYDNRSTLFPGSSPAPTDSPATLFVALAQDPDLSYHLDSVATMSHGADYATASGSGDYSGRDAAFEVSVRSTLPSIANHTTRGVIKDGISYQQDGQGPWVKSPGSDAHAARLSEMLQLDRLEYVGRELHDGEWLNHLRIPSEQAGGMGCLPSVMVMDLWVRDDGVPVSGVAESPCTLVRGIEGPTSYSYDYSKVGEPITIEIPAEFR